ncbi:hypothetical protein M7963_22945 [Enterobacter roggenkampii]|uniref:hypothetical protein n=1 Tax=Enterobacter roggenkampii TaxID=1812935 RepID=UPI002238F70E|nr:hypothetical protein [Enterobacter roggenkampii]MCW5004350.1 hypothetical protein [Enterobacter roggenkampii]
MFKIIAALPLFISSIVFCETGEIHRFNGGSTYFAKTEMADSPARPATPFNNAGYRINVPQNTIKFPVGNLSLCPLEKKRAVHPQIPDNAFAIEFIHPTQPDIPYCFLYVFDGTSVAVNFNLFYWVAENHWGSTHSRNAYLSMNSITYSTGKTLELDGTNAIVLNCSASCRDQYFRLPILSSGERPIIGLSLNFAGSGKILLVGPRGVTPSGSLSGASTIAYATGMDNIVKVENYNNQNKLISTDPLSFNLGVHFPNILATSVPEQVVKTCSVSADSAKSEAVTSRFNPSKYIDFPVVGLILDCSHINVSANSTDKHTIRLTKTVTNLKNKNGVEIPFVPRKYHTPIARGKDQCKGEEFNIEAWLNTPENIKCDLEIDSTTGTLTGFGKVPTNKYKISLGADWSSLTTVPESGDYSATYILTVVYN